MMEETIRDVIKNWENQPIGSCNQWTQTQSQGVCKLVVEPLKKL